MSFRKAFFSIVIFVGLAVLVIYGLDCGPVEPTNSTIL